jgi:hypothetical protein
MYGNIQGGALMSTDRDDSKWQFYTTIAKGLEEEPAYLLMFAVVCLFALSGVGRGLEVLYLTIPSTGFAGACRYSPSEVW